MIFTPEESREIAEEMLKWDRIPGYAHDVWHECWFDSAGRFVSVSLPDFSQPEWTGAMLESILRKYWVDVEIVPTPTGSVNIRATKEGEEGVFFEPITNRNLYDAWRWLKNKEASDDKS